MSSGTACAWRLTGVSQRSHLTAEADRLLAPAGENGRTPDVCSGRPDPARADCEPSDMSESLCAVDLLPSARPGLPTPGVVRVRFRATWLVMREPRLLLSACGPGVAPAGGEPRWWPRGGAIEHSTYSLDPYGRLERTVRWVTVVCFGMTRGGRAHLRSRKADRRWVGDAARRRGRDRPGVPAGMPD